MGVIQKIRDKAGLMLILVGGAMLLFLVDPASLMGYKETYEVIGRVGDYEIKTQDYQNYVNNQKAETDKNKEQAFEKAWEEWIKYNVYQHIFSTTHIAYSEDERNHLLYEEVHPNVMQMVMNWDRQSFNGKYQINYMNGGDAIRQMISDNSQNLDMMNAWNYFADNNLKETVKSEKYINLLKSGMYVPTAMAKKLDADKNTTYRVRYVSKSLGTINDSVVEVSEQEMKDYYNANLSDYKSTATRDIKYVEFKVIPSDDDYNKVKEDVNAYAEQLLTQKDRLSFASSMGGNQDRNFYTNAELEAKGLDALFTDENAVVGPTKKGNSWVINTFDSRRMIPDSVTVAHILIKPGGKTGLTNGADVYAFADSLADVYRKDTTGFAADALKYSDDPGSANKGGHYDWFKQGTMVPAFNDSCFFGNKGDIKVAPTNFGVHVIVIQDQSKKVEKVRLATITRSVQPSKKTYDYYRSKSSKFARDLNSTEEFETAVLNDRTLFNANAKDLKPTSHEIIGLKNARRIVLWAFNNEEGSVSSPFDLSGSFVVATVTKANDTEYQPFESVKTLIEVKLKDDKKKEMLKEEMKSAMAGVSTIEDVSNKLNLGGNVDEDPNARFTNKGLQGKAGDGQMVGLLSNVEKGKIVGPFAGNKAVYVMVVEENENAGSNQENSYLDDIQEMEATISNAVNQDLIEAYKDILGVEDNRLEVFKMIDL